MKDEEIFGIDPDLGQWDASRTLKSFDNVLVGSQFVNLSKHYEVTLATQVLTGYKISNLFFQ